MPIKKIILLILLQTIAATNNYAQKNNELSGLFTELRNAKDSLKPAIYNRICFYYASRDKFDSTLYYANMDLQLSEKLGNKKEMGHSYNNMGNVYRIYSDFDKAIEFYTKALAIYEKNNLYRKAEQTMGNIANVYGDQLQYIKEREAYIKVIEYSKTAKDTIYLINAYASLATNYSISGNIAKARACIDTGFIFYEIKKSYAFNNKADSSLFTYNVHYLFKTLAKQLYDEKKFDSSISLYKKLAGEITEENGVWNKDDLLLGIAKNFVETNNMDSALRYTNIALEVLKKDSIPQSYMNIYELQASIYEKQGRFKDAYYAFQKYKTLSDSIINNKNFKAISTIQARFETQKKDLLIVQLNNEKKSQNLIIILAVVGFLIALGFLVQAYRAKKLQKKLFAQKEELLIKEKKIETGIIQKKMTELEQMALRAQMNPHFIFNSLNSVQHFVMNKDVEGVNKYLGAFAHLIRQTLNNSGKPLVSLEEEVKYLDTYLSLEKMKTNDRFNYTITVENNIDMTAIFVPGMILQPFIENSIKHGITQKEKNDGQININFSATDKLVCLIEDNGIGRQRAGEVRSASTDTVYESKGMDITMHRIETINKIYETDISVQINDKKDVAGEPTGTVVRVEFPVNMD